MQSSILVATPQAAFGELIRQSLEQTGRYRVEVAYQGDEAVQRCRRPGSYQLVILDGDLPEADFGRLAAEIRAAQPGARIAALPTAAQAGPGGPDAPGVDGTLDKPFYLPSLPAAIERLIRGSSPEAPAGEDSPGRPAWQNWLPENGPALERLASACQAVGALLLRTGEAPAGAGVCTGGAWAGALAGALENTPFQPAGAETVLYRAAPGGPGWVMVYAVQLEPAGQLALVFPEAVTYSQARMRFAAAGLQKG